MIAVVSANNSGGSVCAPPSKSAAHRALICAALSDRKTLIECPVMSADISATTDCLRALGSDITYENGIITVNPINKANKTAVLNCGESGSTLRFMIPVAAALGVNAQFTGKGRLAQRPTGTLLDALTAHGIKAESGNGNDIICIISGTLTSGKYEIRADISSQFITGLLLALVRVDGDSEIILQGNIASASYINMTLAMQKAYGITHRKTEKGFFVTGGRKYISPEKLSVEGDFSNAAFWIVGGAIGKKGITVSGIDPESTQGDRKIIDILRTMGADISCNGTTVTVLPSKLTGCEIDALDIPDLVPVLSVAASAASGKTIIRNTKRLREKESDRVETTLALINNLGGSACCGENYIEINGKGFLIGGSVDSFNDHRIAMSGAVASVICENEVTIAQAEAVAKSYPDFFEKLISLGGKVEIQ